MAGGCLNEESDGERDRPIGRYTQMVPAGQTEAGRQFTDTVQPPTHTRTIPSHQPAQQSQILRIALSENYGAWRHGRFLTFIIASRIE
jgi:hypothetical protein